jgi:hypothetical protein
VLSRPFFFLASLSLLLGLAALSQSGEKPSLEKKEVSQAEIKKLVLDLGHADFRIREMAMKKLSEIGEPALEPLYEAQKSKNPEISQRAKLLIPEIEWRVLPSKTVNGMQFRLVVDKKWAVPKLGEKNFIKITLEIKNVRDRVFQVFPGGVQVSFTNLKGKELGLGAGNEHSCAPWYSPPLKKNQTFSIKLQAFLVQSSNNLLFSVKDSFTNCWDFNGLSKGTYVLQLQYRNLKEFTEGLTNPLWVGEVHFRNNVEIE